MVTERKFEVACNTHRVKESEFVVAAVVNKSGSLNVVTFNIHLLLFSP